MKRLLMVTAAVIALAVAAPIATAQYTTPPPATAPYSTPAPSEPMTPQDEVAAAQEDNTTSQPQSPTTTPGAPETSDPMPSTTAETQDSLDATTQAQTDMGATQPQAQTGVDSTMQAQTDSTMQPQSTYAGASMDAGAMAAFEQHARDAGMEGVPMTAQEVCMPRRISLTTSGASLNRDKEHQLINAADRASACQMQRVTISSPNGRADEARQLLIDHGVDANMIEVVDGEASGLDVQMNFAGVATSSEQYAQMFSTQQLASYQPSAAAPSYQPAAPAPAPDATTPGAAEPSPPMEDPSMQTPESSADPMDDAEDPMSPTSGEPALQPDGQDI